MTAVEVRGLRKSYRGRAVVDGVDLAVEPGEVFGVLGRNGAGKTTTVECAVGLRTPDNGAVRVFGVDPRVQRDRIRQSVGDRKYGILRRLAVTPARPSMILGAQMVVILGQELVGGLLMMIVGAAFFGVTMPESLVWASLAGVLLLAAMYGVGITVAAVAPTVNAALAIGLVAFFAMLALGGGFGPIAELPRADDRRGDALRRRELRAVRGLDVLGQDVGDTRVESLTQGRTSGCGG